MKQTAVQWLETILEGQKDKPFDFDEWSIAFEHAKAMEKDQIKFFFEKGHLYSGCPYGLDEIYNKTFKSE